MKAVAIITPEPKYFAKKNAHVGTLSLEAVFAKIGKRAPRSSEPQAQDALTDE